MKYHVLAIVPNSQNRNNCSHNFWGFLSFCFVLLALFHVTQGGLKFIKKLGVAVIS